MIIPQDILAVDWNHAAHAVRIGQTPQASSGPRLSLFKKRPKVAAFTALSAPSVSSALFQTRPWISKLFWDYRTINATAPWHEMLRELEELQPDVIICYASLAGRLAQAKLDGKLRLDMPTTGAISTGGDCLTAGIRSLCKQAFGLDPMNGYGCGETLGIARQWQGMPHMLIFEDIVILEAVDAQERACQEGVLSHHALVTPLINTALPLLRYRLEDRLSLGPIQEAWPFQTIGELIGRSNMSYVFKVPETQIFNGSKLISIMETLPQVMTYQFRQTGMDELECRFVMRDVEEAEVLVATLQREVRDSLDCGGCRNVKFKTVSVHSLQPDTRTGKVEQNAPLPFEH